MPVIRCTSKLLADIDDPPVADSTVIAPSPTGDWYGHIFTVERRKGILFINEPTLFVCLAIGITKLDYRRIAPFFFDLLAERFTKRDSMRLEPAWILGLHKNMAIGRTLNRSTIASLNNRIGDTRCIIQYEGGLENCDVAVLAHLLNDTPMKPIGYSRGA